MEDILFGAAASAAPEEAAAAVTRRALILPSMTIDPADTKTPYSDATQVGKKEGRGRAGEELTC